MSSKQKSTEAQAQQYTLPFEEITNRSNRDSIRAASKVGGQSYFIDISIVKFREKFNVRDIIRTPDMTDEDWLIALQIPELAQLILENGQEQPVTGDFVNDGKVFIINDGYRRTLAKRYLLNQGHTVDAKGKPINLIEVINNPKETTELDRFLHMIGTDTGKLKYSDRELAYGLKILKENFKLSNEMIAQKVGRSRQWVDNQLALASFPPILSNAIDKGLISVTAATQLNRLFKDEPDKMDDILAKAIANDQKIQVKDIEALSQPEKPKEEEKTTIPPPDETNKNDDDDDDWDDDDDVQPNSQSITEPNDDDDIDPPPVVENLTKSINNGDTFEQEAKSRQTSDKPKEHKPKNDSGDALDKIDFSKEKTEIEMDIDESIKMLDKLNTKMSIFPEHLKQYTEEIVGMATWVQNKMIEVKEKIKKAPVRGEI